MNFSELHQPQLFARDPLALILRHAFHFETERDVAKRGAPREQLSEILEYDAAIHTMAVDLLAADADFAGRRRQKAGDDVKQRGLAAAGWPDDADEFRGARYSN